MEIIAAERLFDGLKDSALEKGGLLVDGDRIVEVGFTQELLTRYPSAELTHFPGCTILPGLVNCHSHTVMPGDGSSVEDAMTAGDDQLFLRAAENVRRSLRAGVTTLADLGARNDVAFTLRDAVETGSVDGPRLVLAGRAVTSPRGHCWQFNAEVSNREEMDAQIDSLLERGADLLKIMANGGGTLGTDPFNPQFDEDLLAFAVNKAHEAGKPAFAHCSCTTVVRQAVRAGFDVIVHGNFNRDRDVLDFDEELAKEAADKGTRWNPTLEITRCGIRKMEDSGESDEAIARRWHAYEQRELEIERLKGLGITMLAGSDEGWGTNAFGTFHREVEALTRAGHTPVEALRSATSLSAESLGVGDLVGSFAPKMASDILVVAGNPLEDIACLSDVRAVWCRGIRVDRGE